MLRSGMERVGVRRPWQTASGLTALGVLALLGACGAGGTTAGNAAGAAAGNTALADAEPVRDEDLPVVGVTRVRALDGGSIITATGAFRREREIDLAFRIGGALRQVNFREGDVISAGALVAAIDPTGVEAQVAQARASAAQASAGVGQAVEQARAAQASVAATSSGVAQARAAAAQAEAGLAQARANLANVERDFQRDETLHARGFVAQARLDARRTQLDVARATESAARSALNAARAGVGAAEAGVDQAQAGAGAAQAGIAAAAGRVQGAEAGIAAAQFDRRWSRLISPATGVVLARLVEPGEVVAPGQPILSLADEASPLILRTPVSDRDVARIRVGDVANIRVAAIGADLRGEVVRVAERADPRTGAFDVDLRVNPGGAIVRTGFFAEARILAAPADAGAAGRVLVAAEALIEASGPGATLYVMQPDGRSVRKVAAGFHGFSGDDAILSGLPVGTIAVTTGGGFISDGARVRMVDLAASAPRTAPAAPAAK